MGVNRKKGLESASAVYWFLLVYVVAALVWWFVSLVNQVSTTAAYQEQQVRYTIDSLSQKTAFDRAINHIQQEKRRAETKYVAEGVTFMIVIFVGAFFVYRSVRRQLRMQQQQQNFMMAVTHELKTPIAVARLNLETMQKHRLDEGRQQKLIQMTLQETLRLHALTSNILVSSQLEGGGYKRSIEELDLSQLCLSCTEDFQQRFPDRNWDMHIEPDIDIEGDALLLEIMINNLLENAHKYSPRGTSIGIRLERTGHEAVLKITEDERKKIFDKFYRIGNEEVRKTKGTGLGLHLVRKIAKDHHADIYVTNNLPSGSIFTITFHRIGNNDQP
jgi:two-component system, OmpR family, sensor histidine kinase CiaH